ncbi:chromodomain-helicase-DNA-binding protein 8 [Protopterus annectens]|uniref:chromodomain-helicase-DNA-binding protein 8 n=1 Tax=Protopterus annectens TaxID=7888 RepID=UPI001CFA08A9|nr:chromodomain-helicase-DNA-binding protein 8 [Protopterus annectens]
MADPIMDLFDDPNLFGLDSLTDDSFDQSRANPIEDVLGLTDGLDSLEQTAQSTDVLDSSAGNETVSVPQDITSVSQQSVTVETQPVESLSIQDFNGDSAAAQQSLSSVQLTSQPQGTVEVTAEQQVLSQSNPFMGVSANINSIPTQNSAASMPVQKQPKIIILRTPATTSVSGGTLLQSQAGQQSILTIPAQGPIPATGVTQVATTSGQMAFTKVLTGVPLRPGMSIVSGNTVLATKVAGQGGVQRIIQPSGQTKQVVLQPVQSQQTQGNVTTSAIKPAVTLAAAPGQGESKRITLVLQQPQQGGQQGQRHVVLGNFPGKIVLQGNQLAALTQAKNAQGQPAKVVTIQLQVQNPQQKIQIVQQPVTTAASGPPMVQTQVIGQAQGQRLSVPLKLVLQPRTTSTQGNSSTISVMKVVNAGETATQEASEAEDDRKLDHQRKQEKANRIVAEAIARARARGERNIPRVLNEDELPLVKTEDDEEFLGEPKKKKKKSSIEKGKEEKGKKPKTLKFKTKSAPSTITPVVGKKRRRNPSSDTSDVELTPPQSPKEEEETAIQKRRSNRQVIRKKYTEDLDIKITDDEDDDVDVIGPVKVEHPVIEHVQEVDAETAPSMQFFMENPSEEDAAIVDKILSMRLTPKEISPGNYIEIEEFYVKYKNYSYLHCEWATIEQLEKDKRIHQKVKRFRTKMAQMRHLFNEDEEPFNPDYVEVDRILEESHSIDKDSGETVIYYLVKWCSLPYEDSTWELKEDVDEAKIEEFKQIQAREAELRRVARPAASLWKKFELSRQYKNGNELREYQLEGINWLLFNWYNRQNCILADEMGLGKTIQSIAFLQEVYSTGIHGPFLVIAPLSTITNWEREFNTWTDMNTILYHGSLASRQMIQQYEMYCKDSKGRLIPGAYKFDALITTFEMVLSDCPELREIEFRCVIIDEAHRLKNRNCKLLSSLKHMDLEHKVLLTGTPLQNTVEELFSLLHFLEPSQFPSEAEFLKEFGDLKTEEQVQKLQAILKPMMLRRLKEDVEKNLAPKQETIIEVELTNIQKKYYRAILEKNFSFLSKGTGQANIPNLLNTMMELRKCCNHPYLIKGAEEKILAECRESCGQLRADFHLQAMVRSSGKLVLIDKLLPKLKAGGHKVLIFSQMVRCLDILEDYLIQKRYLYERIDGRVRGNLRQAAIDRFSKPDSDRFVFLLCTRAGGLGINLTAADTCIIFDSDWNPQNDLQAQARCHRIGQSKAVKVYRLITRNSYEREMFDKASLKLGLDKAVLQSMSGRESNVSGIQQFTKKEIEDLLRKGAYAAIMDEDDESSKFCEEDIDQILQRRTTTITIETEGKGSTFAKASFVASENRTDISLDDPNFWQKWAKKADLDIDSLSGKNNLVIDTPRVRKQTRQYSTLKDDHLVEFSDLESDEDERPRSRRHDRHHGYGRTDCFRVEKHLLVYGWGRWKDILAHGRFKRRMTERDVEAICRAILVYCLLHYKGDESIKGFIWELITPGENGKAKELQNHSGLSIPVPRGRKGKKVKSQSTFDIHKADWVRKYNPETLFVDASYKKHLKHQCNKVLLRVRMLYYLRQEVIGDQAQKVLNGVHANEIDIWLPEVDRLEVPSDWWDTTADKSLIIGVFKHGYEKYTTMRADPALCFLERAGRPDEQAIAAEQRVSDSYGDALEGPDFDKDSEDPEYRPLLDHQKDHDDEVDPMMVDEEMSAVDRDTGQATQVAGQLWPSASALTARLRRLITAYQRSYRREQMKMEAAERGDQRRRCFETAFKLKEIAKREKQQRWTCREVANFYRVVSNFGVEFYPERQCFDWNRFRTFAHLERKTDESLTKYFLSFMAMCRRVSGRPPEEGDDATDPSVFIDPITEERASRALYRIELMRRVREQVLLHPQLDERLAMSQPSPELPEWWECPKHDKELLLGAAKHGMSRTDSTIMQDPDFSFLAARMTYMQSRQAVSRSSTPLLQQLAPAQRASPLTVQVDSHEKTKTLPDTEVKQGTLAVSLESDRLSVNMPLSRTEMALDFSSTHMRPPVFQKPNRRSGDDMDSESDIENSSSSSTSSHNSEDDKEEKLSTTSLSHSKVYDEESVTSFTMSQDGFLNEDGDQTVLEMLQERQRYSEWPKDHVLITRLDNLCHVVLMGWWPNRRIQYDGGSAQPPVFQHPPAAAAVLRQGECHMLTSTGVDASALVPGSVAHMEEENSAAMAQFTKLKKNPSEKEFTVKIKDEDGLKLTFQKHKLLLNGALAEGQASLFKKKKGLKRVMESEGGEGGGSMDEVSLRRLEADLDAHIPVVNKADGMVLLGEEAPRRGDLERWLQQHPNFVVDPRFLLLSEDRQKKRQRRDSPKLELRHMTGLERVQMVNVHSGRKLGGAYNPSLKDLKVWLDENPDYAVSPEWAEIVRHSGLLPDSMYNHILLGPIGTEACKKQGQKRQNDPIKVLSDVSSSLALGSINISSCHPCPPNLQSSGLDHSGMASMLPITGLRRSTVPHLDTRMFFRSGLGVGLPGFPETGGSSMQGVKLEALEQVEMEGEDLTQDFDDSEKDYSLHADPLMSVNSDSEED